MRNKHRYSPDWKEKIRPFVLRRDAYKCRVCGALNHSVGYYEPNGSYVQCDAFMQAWAIKYNKRLVTVHLQVAHLDQNPSNNDFENLRTMCPKHHLQYDHEFNRLKRVSQAGKK